MFRHLLLAALVLVSGLAAISRAEDDIIVETPEDAPTVTAGDFASTAQDVTGDENVLPSTISPDADTTLYFTFPVGTKDVPVNKPVRLLIGFRNKGDSVFMVDGLEASLRYPMDWSYTIANLTSVRYSREVAAQEEVTFDYGFMLSDAFSSRPFTLSINLHYRDATNRAFFNPVFNETITVIEVDEGLDSQTFFLYVMFLAAIVLAGVLIQQYINSKSKKRPVRKATQNTTLESGTSKVSDVDYDWLPESTLRQINKSPKKSPSQTHSPQQSPKAKKRI
ncbi:hypothetical protein RvY_18967 [Ramazzottius varieornatus]|uniref:Translocon-associated protein subunit alpha n=1 Tax=Ramazzottius varieornatus TaxID=947166 RepID=A0A1D1W7Q4_RAMVA|nr:hypothetical protein RvY_18967 [Ramazzottius varieornatus]